MLLLFRVWHELRVEMDSIQAQVCVLVGILTYCKPCVALRSALTMKHTEDLLKFKSRIEAH